MPCPKEWPKCTGKDRSEPLIGKKPNYFHSDAVQIKNSQHPNLDRSDANVNGVNPILTVESSRERKKFRVSSAKRVRAGIRVHQRSNCEVPPTWWAHILALTRFASLRLCVRSFIEDL